jgi:hypothetical protein
MTVRRLFAVAFIYLVATVAWGSLGGSLVARTGEFDARLRQEVSALWGGEHAQAAPDAWIERPGTVTEEIEEKDVAGRTMRRTVAGTRVSRIPVQVLSSRVDVHLALEQRRKGLLWYDTYGVVFTGAWRVRNPDPEPRRLVVQLRFPSTQAIYEGFGFSANGVPAAPVSDLAQGATAAVELAPGEEATLEAAYTSRGLGQWTYAFGPSGVAQVEDFRLVMRTDFRAIDFPAGTMSPTRKAPRDAGWDLAWEFDRVVTGQRIGMDLPNRTNPGPWAARVTFFAPVGLLFFLAVTVILGVVRGVSLHPMHYAFIAAAFFAFHLLLAYLVDHVDVHAALALASLVSVGLVVSYLSRVARARSTLAQAAVAQLVFLVLFSYAFFLEGYTGLTVTIGAIVTLFVLMQATARVDWTETFRVRDAVSTTAR